MLEFFKLLERLLSLVEWAIKGAQTQKLRQKIEEKVKLAKEKRSQIPLEEITGEGGLPSRRKYSGMRVEEKRTGVPSDGGSSVGD